MSTNLLANSHFVNYISVPCKSRIRTCSWIGYFPKVNPETPYSLTVLPLAKPNTKHGTCENSILLGQ